jgi:hypothetical protein
VRARDSGRWVVREGEGKKGLLRQAARETRPSKGMPIGRRYNTQGSDDGRSAAKTNQTRRRQNWRRRWRLKMRRRSWPCIAAHGSRCGPLCLREHRHPCRNPPKPTSTSVALSSSTLMLFTYQNSFRLSEAHLNVSRKLSNFFSKSNSG